MDFVNAARKESCLPKSAAEKFILLLAPFAPHMAEEIWQRLGHGESLAYHPWPQADAQWLQLDEMVITVHINGKKKAEIKISRGQNEDEIKTLAQSLPAISEKLAEGSVKKVIYVPEKLVNFIM
jgi:leucyl-tRNA synthetase